MIKLFCFDDDVWYLESLGKELDSYRPIKKIDFQAISQPWLKVLVKRHIMLESNLASSTLEKIVIRLEKFSQYLEKDTSVEKMEDLTRDIILNFVYQHTKKHTPGNCNLYLGTLRKFIDNGNLNGWFKLSPYLILDSDYPKPKSYATNDIPKVVLDQIFDNLHLLPEPIARMVLVAFFCGMRISEVALCPLDCISQDSKGNWAIRFWQKKGKQEHILPITTDIAKVIQEQQGYIRQHFGNNFNYLFCARHKCRKLSTFNPKPKCINPRQLSLAINRLIEAVEIKDDNGRLWVFTAHQLRHSRATDLFESGNQFVVVRKWLNHKSPRSTAKYVNVNDGILRTETAKVQSELTNYKGESINPEELPPSFRDNPESHRLNYDDHVNTPIYGLCGLAHDQDCPHWKACYTCSSFVAHKELLPDYIKVRDELKAKQTRAKEKGELVMAEQFKQQADNLDAVITSFEEKSA